jgi:phosphatidylglycerophosphate synthase
MKTRSESGLKSLSTPSIAELRAVTQPESLLARAGAEHWAGRLYMRRVSPYVTRLLVATPITANGVTWLMIATGLLAALALSVPGVLAAIAAAVLAQLWLLLDCCDGEVARWRRTFSPAGIYLDHISHYSADAALVAALGVRAAGGWGSLDGWTMLGLLAAVLVLLVKAESHLVFVARALAGRPPAGEDGGGAPRAALLRRLRRAAGFVPFFRVFGIVNATLLTLAAAVVDAVSDDLVGSRGLLLGLVAAAALTAVGHLVMILSSDRLR